MLFDEEEKNRATIRHVLNIPVKTKQFCLYTDLKEFFEKLSFRNESAFGRSVVPLTSQHRWQKHRMRNHS